MARSLQQDSGASLDRRIRHSSAASSAAVSWRFAMAKEGQHKNDAHDQTKSRGHNNPSKSVTITTGSRKKQETYRKQAGEHKDTARRAQSGKNAWNEDTRDKPT